MRYQGQGQVITSHSIYWMQLLAPALEPWGPSQYKMLSCQYRHSGYQDKMVSQPSHLYNGNTHTVFAKLHRHISFCWCWLLNGRCWGKILCIKMYWTSAKMLLLADVGEHSFANTAHTWMTIFRQKGKRTILVILSMQLNLAILLDSPQKV